MIATILAIAVAALHLYFLALEMFLWEAPRTRKAFGTSADHASATKVMAANQGLYNGFLAVGILWGLWANSGLAIFMLLCVLVAGLYGGATVSRKIALIQALPAALALLAMWSAI